MQIIRLEPHDPVPTGPGRNVVVLHRFAEDDPDQTITTITLTGKPDEVTRPAHPNGTLMSVDEAIEAAGKVAKSEKIDRVYVADRTHGEREKDILAHHGDHSVHMEHLVDSDVDNGEHGSDMRPGS